MCASLFIDVSVLYLARSSINPSKVMRDFWGFYSFLNVLCVHFSHKEESGTANLVITSSYAIASQQHCCRNIVFKGGHSVSTAKLLDQDGVTTGNH